MVLCVLPMPEQRELAHILALLALVFMLAPYAVVLVLAMSRRARLRQQRDQERREQRLALERSYALHEAEGFIRKQLAADLHDELGLHLSLLLIDLRIAAKASQEGTKNKIEQAIAQADDFKDLVRKLINQLKNVDVLHEDPLKALNGVIRDVRSMGQFTLHFDKVAALPPLTADQHLFLRCMLQEGLHNIIVHARAKTVQAALTSTDNQLTLHIVDDGVGFDTATAASNRGLGNIRLRCKLLGGDFTVDSKPGHGTTLMMRFPLTPLFNIEHDETKTSTHRPRGPCRQPPGTD